MSNDYSEFFETDKPGVKGRLAQEMDGYVLGDCLYKSEKGFNRLFLLRRMGRLFMGKALREEYRGDSVAEAALRKEFQIGFSIDCPGAVKTYDFGELPEIGSFLPWNIAGERISGP